nr:tocopherol cyclase family protein [uncultured Clostridium sp.]
MADMKNKGKFFAGWYFKIQSGDTVLALIPGLSMDGTGNVYPFIQVIWNEQACWVDFKEEDLLIDWNQKRIILDDNIFSRRGVRLNIKTDDISLKGIIRFGPITPIRYPIMGPFQIMPFMECKHEIISMSHRLSGKVKLNGAVLDFGGGLGYIEGDKGKSFPESYLWLQCNSFSENASVMVSVAKIPWLGFRFEGCISVIMYQGKEYRFATYLGARVVSKRETAVIIKQGAYILKVFLSNQNRKGEKRFSHQLLAPSQGEMSRFVKEEHLLRGRFLLYKGENMIFDLSSSSVSFEYDL